MSAAEILELLRVEGIEISSEGGQLRLRATKAKITDAQKALITGHKAVIVTYLNPVPDAQNAGSRESSQQQVCETITNASNVGAEVKGAIFKKYIYPDGQILELTKEEFGRVVEAIRLLWIQDEKLKKEKGVFELEEKGACSNSKAVVAPNKRMVNRR